MSIPEVVIDHPRLVLEKHVLIAAKKANAQIGKLQVLVVLQLARLGHANRKTLAFALVSPTIAAISPRACVAD